MSGTGWPVELADPDPAWREAAWEAIREVWQVVEPWRDGGVHHVGSTAVPEVPAEPVIDLFAGLAGVDVAPDAAAALTAAGWRPDPAGDPDDVARADADPAAPGPRYTKERGEGAPVAVELLVPGGARWRTAILFRDRLRADAERRREYARVKRRAAARCRDREGYEQRKTAFVRRVTS
jgi:dephospho-CoA kinase